MAYKVNGNVIIDDSGNAAFTNFLPVGTPRNTSPADGETDVGPTNIELTLSDYEGFYQGTIPLKFIQVQVANASSFATANIVYDSGNAAPASSNTVSVLTANTVFYWRGRYINNNDVHTDFSEATSFTTRLVPTVLGESYGGGYYTGTIDIGGGTCYYLILSPASGGYGGQRQWKTSDTATNAASCCDGYDNTYTYLDNATHPAGYFTSSLALNGYSDWYLPSCGEWVPMYDNRASMPPGEGYATGIKFWTSTRDGPSTTAWAKCTTNGGLYSISKTAICYVRAIRREPL